MTPHFFAFAFACLLLCTDFANAGEWTRFRGPNGTGVGTADAIPSTFTEQDYHFKTKLPGDSGCSSPVVWNDRVFVMSADSGNATRYLVCLNATTGKIEWQHAEPSEPHHLHTRSSYASCTPAVDETHVYFAWSTPNETTLKAYLHDGTLSWSRDLGRWQSQHGFGTSPIVYKDMVILHNSQQADKLKPGDKPGQSFMMAFDAESGADKWKTELVSKNVCYSVPFVHTTEDGRDELICSSTGNGIFSIDPVTGQENWTVNDDLFSMRTVGSPIAAGGHIFGSTGSGRYSGNYIVAVNPGPNGALAYKIENSSHFKAPYVPCLIADGDLVFCMYDRGFASCINAVTGDVHWTERTGAEFSGSPVRIGDRIFCVDESGLVWVFAASTDFQVLGKSDLGEDSRSTPAVANGRLYLRTNTHLISVGG